MALLVAQTRVESGVHSVLEVARAACSARSRHSSSSRCSRERSSSSKAEEAVAAQRVRAVLAATSSARSCARATAASSRGSTSRTPPIRSASAPRRRRSAPPRPRAAGRATSPRSAITASPCGGCRQWLHEWRIAEVSYRRDDGTIGTATAASCCRTRGTCRSEVGLRRRRRPPERRQVDARQRARRARRSRSSPTSPAHDAAPHPRRLHDATTRSSCSSTCPAGSGRSTP